MGNSCGTSKFLPQHQLNALEHNIRSNSCHDMTSNTRKKANACFLEDQQLKENQYLKIISQMKYVEQKILQQQKTFSSERKTTATSTLRFKSKGNLFFKQKDIKTDVSIMNQRQNVEEIMIDLDESDIKQITSILDNHFLFLQLNEIQKKQIIKVMKKFESQAGSYVFREGDNAERFFIICQGQVDVIIDNDIKKRLKSKQYFGQIALLFGSKRTASVRCVTKCIFWGIDRLTFKRIVHEINHKLQKQNRQFLQKTDFFSNFKNNLDFLTPIQQQTVLNLVITFKYKSNETIINDGGQIFIVKNGSVTVSQQNGQQIVLTKGDYFGDKSYEIQKQKTPLNVKANIESQIVCITKDRVIQVLGSTILNVMIINKVRKAMEKSKRFNVILHKSLNSFARHYKIKRIKKGEKLFKKGHIMKNFYIPLSVSLISANRKYEIEEIIEQDLLIDNLPLLHGIISQSDGQILVIKANENIFKQAHNFRSQIDINSLRFDNIQIIRKIGAGQFGDVYVGVHLLSNCLVAIKSISKRTIQKFNIQNHISNQQNTMKMLKHPFIIKYYNTFISPREVYFILEYIQGKQLFEVIRQMGLLNSCQAQFFSAQILLALQYMHNLQIIYRDLKPENIMVDSSGYLKIIDFGTAKCLKKQNNYKTRTVIGTPYYMSPQAISGKGYSFQSDLWSFGVILYELLCGYLPYQQKNNDPFLIYKQILNDTLQFPGYMRDNNTRELITKLLSKTPHDRMGYLQLKRMPFYEGLDWVSLQKKQIPSVYKMPKNIGIDLSSIHRQGLLTMKEFFQKKAMKQGIIINKKSMS